MPRTKQGRNSNGESSIYLGTDGRYHGRVTVGVKDNGKPDRRHVSAKERPDVVRKVRDLEKMRDAGTVQEAGTKWTVEQWLDHWLHNIAVMTTTENGWDAYFYAVKHLKRGVGAHKLNKLAPNHLESLYRRMLAEGAKKGTVHGVHRTVRAALNEAKNRDFVTKNVATIAKTPTPDEEEVEPLTKDEVRSLFTAARKDRNSTRWIVAIALGLRQGEALGLQWGDLDFEEQTLRVRRSRLRPKYKHGCKTECGRKHAGHCPARINTRKDTKDTKSKASKRTIGLPTPLAAELQRHREEQEIERATAQELWQDEGWIFADPLGRKLNARTDQFHWKRLLEAAGVRDARLHDARHTAATVLLELGINQRATMDVMGWSNASMAARYQHVTDEVRRSIADQVGSHLWEQAEGKDRPEEPPIAS
ncbi:tyrosine-type recombinase/integrase [Qaidamihabitans albus]|uniref:tyrosine-type recombinase/integrase n=1 Tax=Qaidamihabitans albus TaxID=2795733 RepID=UPI0018F1B0C2|nr:site-specific integrase [Qaidamihabitans albus]